MPTPLIVGDARVTFLVDGWHTTTATHAFPTSTTELWRDHPEYLASGVDLLMPLGGFLIEIGARRMLVDLGLGHRSLSLDGDSEYVGGGLPQELAVAGVDPMSIDTIVYTHGHLDHVGWTCDRRGAAPVLTFPNANHLMMRAEWQHWLADERGGGPSQLDKELLPARLELVDGEHTIGPGVHMVPSPGHTPGHCSIVVASGASRMLILGDVIHCPVQLADPELGIFADVDPAQARITRQAALRELESSGSIGAFCHFPNLTFGRVLTGSVERQWRLASVPQLGAPD